jgi:predicted metal-dependent hydrolase
VEPSQHDPPDVSDSPLAVEVRRSRRRTRTVSAYRDGDTVVVLIPARLSSAEEQEWVATMITKVGRAERRRRPDDEALTARAQVLSSRYLDGRARAASVRWVTNQQARWGSCTPLDRTIRLSARLRGLPHELTHLLVAGHGDDFWEWVNRFELTERARGFLEGVSTATTRAMST